jgi:hypothetical protein
MSSTTATATTNGTMNSGSSGSTTATSSTRWLFAAPFHLLAQWLRVRPDKQADFLPRQQLQQLHNLPTALNPYRSYYSFNMATVHFLMLDSESPSHRGSPQHSFVVQDLAKVGGFSFVYNSLYVQAIACCAWNSCAVVCLCAQACMSCWCAMYSPAAKAPIQAISWVIAEVASVLQLVRETTTARLHATSNERCAAV